MISIPVICCKKIEEYGLSQLLIWNFIRCAVLPAYFDFHNHYWEQIYWNIFGVAMGVSSIQDYPQSIKPSVVYLWNLLIHSDADTFVSDTRDPTWAIISWASPIQPPLKNCDSYSVGGKREKRVDKSRLLVQAINSYNFI